MVNNYDWMKGLSFLDFIRDVGKHITVNYMMAKGFSEETPVGRITAGHVVHRILLPASYSYDSPPLSGENCRLQMGGSDQWGNITTGTELIRRTAGGEAHALTCPLITKADGGKFGKTESGNVWLDPALHLTLQVLPVLANVSDADAEKIYKIFTELTREGIVAASGRTGTGSRGTPLQNAWPRK